MQSAQLRELLDLFFGEGSESWSRFRDAPAAKVYHQAYRHGLLEHTVSVAQAVSAAAAFFPGIDRDVAVGGALLHDIGKTQAYNEDPLAIDLTDAGRLQGEIPLGYYMVRRRIEDIPGFDPSLAQAVLHIILSHHGSLEHGSPVVPATREAVLVHMIDNLGGRLGSFDRLERELPAGDSWSGFDRALSGSGYFGARAPDVRRRAAEAPAGKMVHSPGTPFSACVPRAANSMSEPTTRSLTVPETRTSRARQGRYPRPDVDSDPRDVVAAHLALASVQAGADLDPQGPAPAIARAHSMPRAGPSKVARKPSPVVLISRPR